MKNKAAQSKAWKTVQVARHPDRPQFLDYVSEIFTEFDADAFEEHVDYIIVFKRYEIGFVLKCGLTLRERL